MVVGPSNNIPARRTGFAWAPMALSVGLLVTTAAISAGWTSGWVSAAEGAQPVKDAPKESTPKPASEDSLILRDGRVIKGKFVSETETTVKFRG